MDQVEKPAARPTAALADFVAGLRYEALPEAVTQRARVALLDVLSCGIAGYQGPGAQSCRRALRRFGSGSDGSVVWGTTERLHAPWAAMANAIAARTPKMDDTHLGGKIHPGSFVIPAILAVAEDRERDGHRVSGRAVVEAITAGYEIAVRVSVAAGPAEQRLRGWHPTGTCGPVGAAAAASKILGLDAQATLSALGLGGDQAAGLSLHHTDGSMVGFFHSGHAAAGGILGAYLAAEGFRGPVEVLAASDAGLCHALTGQCDVALLTADLGQRFALVETGMKPYASCRSTHGAVDSAIRLRGQHAFSPDSVRRVTVYTNRIAKMQCRHVVQPGNTVPGGSTSMAYSIAAAICDLTVGPKQLVHERMAREDVQRLAQKVEMIVDPEFDAAYPRRWPCRIEIELEDGTTVTRAVDNPPWEPGDESVDWDAVKARAKHITEGYIAPDRLERLISYVEQLEALTTVADLVRALVWH
jgi:2-methylcitrate dehydratase PrpD